MEICATGTACQVTGIGCLSYRHRFCLEICVPGTAPRLGFMKLKAEGGVPEVAPLVNDSIVSTDHVHTRSAEACDMHTESDDSETKQDIATQKDNVTR